MHAEIKNKVFSHKAEREKKRDYQGQGDLEIHEPPDDK